ncbi:unnamed protein product [Thlaspi arvense]|uniref:Rapid ALkalinization Factor n=1 Tax=Thlaspi arvense TaxID=13288 RepID=A0AAU9RXR0_THLAR|nr:unnamed protein product [Thlaspi arvense]
MNGVLAICLLVICAAMVVKPGESRVIEYGAINPCARPNPPPGCNPPGSEHKDPSPANRYSRGCTKINRCKREPTRNDINLI